MLIYLCHWKQIAILFEELGVEKLHLKTEIKETQERLSSLRKEYKEKKYASLRIAVEAKKEADRALAEEYKALGISSLSYNRGFFL